MRTVMQWLWNIIDVAIAVMLCVMLIMLFTNVIMRYGFSSALRQSVELSRLGLVWLVMLGTVVILKQDKHLAVTELTSRLLPQMVPVLRRICYGIIFVCVSMLFTGAYKQTLENWQDISQITGLPSALFYLAGVVSGGLMMILSFIRIFFPDWLLSQRGDG